jgi:hypothetical protein
MQAIMHRVEVTEMNVNPTNPDTDSLLELGSVGGLAVVTKAGDVVKGSMGLGAESTLPQHIPSMSLKDSHKSDPSSTATLVMLSSNSLKSYFPLHLLTVGNYHN